MSKVVACIHGVYPRSTDFVQISRDVDRKRKEFSELKEQHQIDFDALVHVQKSASLDYFEDGKLNWQDVFRPIVDATAGMEVGPLTRWFNNNSFYRQPLITGKVKLDAKKLDRFFFSVDSSPAKRDRNDEGGQWKVTLPSPFLFAKLVDDTTTASFEKTLAAITEIYSDMLVYLAKKKVKFVQFNEPYIPYHKVKKAEIVLLGKSLKTIRASLRGGTTKQSLGGDRHAPKVARDDEIQFAVHGYFGDTTALVSSLVGNSAIDVLGIDFVHTSLTSMPRKVPHAIIAGVIDGRNSLLEDKKTIATFIEKALKHFQPEILYISNNSDLDLLPESVAKEKVKLLGAIALSFRAK